MILVTLYYCLIRQYKEYLKWNLSLHNCLNNVKSKLHIILNQNWCYFVLIFTLVARNYRNILKSINASTNHEIEIMCLKHNHMKQAFIQSLILLEFNSFNNVKNMMHYPPKHANLGNIVMLYIDKTEVCYNSYENTDVQQIIAWVVTGES